jgi:PAS domain S-box-containing protein
MKPMNLEKKLFERNKLFLKIFKKNTVGMIFTDLETTKFLYVNKSFLKNTGYTKEEVIGKTSLDLNLIETVFRNTQLSNVKDKGELKNVEMLITKKNGKTFWSLTSIQTMIFDEKTYALTTFIDISERKRIEEENKHLTDEINRRKAIQLNEAKNMYRLLADNTVDLVCLHNINGSYNYVSPSVSNLLGYTPQELLGKFPHEFVHPDDFEVCINSIKEFFSKEKNKTFLFKLDLEIRKEIIFGLRAKQF